MSSSLNPVTEYAVHPVTPDRWPDLERLFGPRGACGGCWCMWWRLPRAQFEQGKGAANRAALQALVEAGARPGLLAYVGDEAVGWCALAPRADFPALARSRILKSVDDQPVWSIPCFFIARSWRRRGVTLALLHAAIAYAADQGARILEGYPVDPTGGRQAAAFLYTGIASTFRKAGFCEVARRSPKRPIMRRYLDGDSLLLAHPPRLRQLLEDARARVRMDGGVSLSELRRRVEAADG